jgi:hypothetical protein
MRRGEVVRQVAPICAKDIYGKSCRALNVADDGEFFLRLQTTNGGSSDSDKKELTVNPSRFSPSKVVTTATPVAKRLMAVRNSRGSIAVGAA